MAILSNKPDVPLNLSELLRARDDVAYNSRNLKVEDLIYLSRRHACAELNDKVYGVMSLMGVELRERIRPSYTQSYSDAYKAVFLDTVATTGRLDLLQECFPSTNGFPAPSWVPDWRSDESSPRKRGVQFADSFRACHSYSPTEPEVLVVTGKVHGIVKTIFDPLTQDTDDRIINDKLRELMPNNLTTSRYPSGEKMFDAWTRALFIDSVCDRFVEMSEEETLKNWQANVLKRVGLSPASNYPSIPKWISRVWQGSKYFYTDGGYFGFGTVNAQLGDRVVALLGLDAPLLIRPQSRGTFSVVGPAYVQGMMDSEAFLGQLPDGWSVQLLTGNPRYIRRFLNAQDGSVHKDGPRLEPLVDMLTEKNDSVAMKDTHDPRLSPEALRGRRVHLDTIRLV